MNVGVVAVVVLYKVDPSASPALQALLHQVETAGAFPDHLLIYDNGPASQGDAQRDSQRETQSGAHQDAHRARLSRLPNVRYVHDPANGKLAAAYNCGLRWAQELGAAWLLLSDADTQLSAAYFAELPAACTADNAEVCAIVPRLLVQGRQQSPFYLHALFGRFARLEAACEHIHGVSPVPLMAWNSGALLSVRRLREIGGFPPEFPLDNLDHVVFLELQNPAHTPAQHIRVLDTALPHQLSVARLQTVPLERLEGKLRSDLLFRTRYGGVSRRRIGLRMLVRGLALLVLFRRKAVGRLYLRLGWAALRG